MKKLMITLAFLSSLAKADPHEEMVHMTAHIGASYTITLISDQVYNKIFRLSSNTSALLAIGTAVLAGSLYKLSETHNISQMKDGLVYNSAGAIGAIGTIFVFNLNLPY